MMLSIVLALALCLINIISSIIIYKIALKKEYHKFLKTVFSSLVIRYFLVIIIVWFCLKVLELDKLAFSITFLIATFMFIIIEILYINYRSKLINLQNNLRK